MWIPGSIPPLVVGGDSLAEIRVKRGEWSKNLCSSLRVSSHGPPFLRCELGLVVKDVRESFVELADIVEQRDPLDTALGSLIEPRGVAEYEGIRRDTPDVGASYGVVRVYGVEQCLHGCGPKPFGLGPDRVFAIKESARCSRDRYRHDVAHGRA
jgi:hypothetical protein